MKQEFNRPCKLRDFPDFYNLCFAFERKNFNSIVDIPSTALSGDGIKGEAGEVREESNP
jgi:hypothetical protein